MPILTYPGSPVPEESRINSTRFVPRWLQKAYRSLKQAYENRKSEKASQQTSNSHLYSQPNVALPETNLQTCGNLPDQIQWDPPIFEDPTPLFCNLLFACGHQASQAPDTQPELSA
jgi:hypothetical protein